MKVLLVKTSSMGDVVHTLSAIAEAHQYCPGIQIDWLIERDFADIADLAKDVGTIHRTIPIQFRKWRKQKPLGAFFNPDIKRLKRQLQAEKYDIVLDAQGLLKSVFLARMAKAPIAGFDKMSARESIAATFYQHTYRVDKNQHAIERQRQLFAKTFNYNLDQTLSPPIRKTEQIKQTIVFLHGTTWSNKRYPVTRWRELAIALTQQGYQVIIPHHGKNEKEDARQITIDIKDAEVLAEKSIAELRNILATATAVISVDTGLAHLAAYLGVPTIMLFGPTRPELTGGLGKHTINLVGQADDTARMKRENYKDKQVYSPSMSSISPNEIKTVLLKLIS